MNTRTRQSEVLHLEIMDRWSRAIAVRLPDELAPLQAIHSELLRNGLLRCELTAKERRVELAWELRQGEGPAG